ncbi:MAG: Asp-tRNA(Asn)/Glu-tRNA(Gln) amidotransferase subunit GatB [Culicoidibacterales bacterium]
MNFEVVIGIEIHAEVQSESKMYSPTKRGFGDAVNTNTNVIDWGYPGTLPTLNKGAFDKAVSIALALDFAVAKTMHFDRKNYFYPDNPKGYQVTQQYTPLGVNGKILIQSENHEKYVHITRIHMEEDAGKSHHHDGYSLIDLNRQGLPLVEIVSEPDIRSAKEAVAYVEALRQTLMYLGVNDGKLEEGSIRCDVNVSLRPYGAKEFGVKTEIKNLNSLSNVEKAIDFEVKRHQSILLSGGQVVQETRRFDESLKQTVLMRTKETAADYRYFPESDLPIFTLTESDLIAYKEQLPELPHMKFQRYTNEHNLSVVDANIILQQPAVAQVYDEAVAYGVSPQQVCNWLIGDVQAYLNKQQKAITETAFTAVKLSDLIKSIENGTISSKIAKDILSDAMENNDSIQSIIDKKGVGQISDVTVLTTMIDEVLEKNEQSIEDYKAGKDRAFGYLIGQLMQASKGQANPKLINQLLKDKLESLK